ncbi:MAG: type IV pilus modification protein PilV [Deltaproteobacteria bacterium RBG_13_52_11]|nr:MAG: type IV pilus modification protein PilV [Deltaproteobacteria bacterium RBG_13_52_11]
MDKVKNIKGFTLLEVMIALVILAIGLLGLASLQVMAIKGNSFGQQMTVASTMAQNQLEQLRRTPGTLANGNDIVTDQNGITYTRAWTVNVNQPQQGMNTVVITISWTGPTGQGGDAIRSINIRTII